MDKTVRKFLVAKGRPCICESCKEPLEYRGLGQYECGKCGEIYLDDYGKVRDYLEKNGPTPAVIISRATGVDREMVNSLLFEGRVEIPEGSRQYIKCARCGCSLKFGRVCPECAQAIGDNKRNYVVGEIPKVDNSGKRSLSIGFDAGGSQKGKMHFLNEESERRSRF